MPGSIKESKFVSYKAKMSGEFDSWKDSQSTKFKWRLQIFVKDSSNLDSSEASGPDYIPVVVLENCEPELLYILAELFNMCLKESCFPDF